MDEILMVGRIVPACIHHRLQQCWHKLYHPVHFFTFDLLPTFCHCQNFLGKQLLESFQVTSYDWKGSQCQLESYWAIATLVLL